MFGSPTKTDLTIILLVLMVVFKQKFTTMLICACYKLLRVFDYGRFYFTAWCLKNENVNCVILGASTVDQLYENIQSMQVGGTYLFFVFIL